MRITGGCHCGHVRYEAEIDPQCVSVCHCTDCQMLTGSPFRVTALTARDRLKLVASAPQTYRKTGDRGTVRIQHFCPHCGSPLFTTGEDGVSDDLGIRWGSIDQCGELAPRRAIWCRSAAPWIGEVGALPGRPTD